MAHHVLHASDAWCPTRCARPSTTPIKTLWLVVGAPPAGANTLEMTPEQLAFLYPDGPEALPPELS